MPVFRRGLAHISSRAGAALDQSLVLQISQCAGDRRPGGLILIDQVQLGRQTFTFSVLTRGDGATEFQANFFVLRLRDQGVL